ncbi:hypothetical protein GCM10027422_42860 [Hymenobacter arcticus]
MKNLFPAWPLKRSLRGATLALGLLAASTEARAQAPTSIYALGTITQNGYVFAGTTYNAGDQLLATLNPAALNSNTPFITAAPVKITGITGNQQIVGIDVRPATAQLYALGYDKSRTTQNAQIYLLAPNGVLTPVAPGVLMDLNLADTNPANTRGLLPNVGFDFNPRADRLRVVAPNRTDYRLNPNTGVVVAIDGQLTYAAGSTVGHTPYIGTAAYTNSAVGLAGTTLYDIDVTNADALLATQNPPNTGTLNPVNSVTFAVNGSTSYVPIASPTIGLGLDIFYDRTGAQDLAYVIEARYSDLTNTDPKNGGGPTGNDRFASNLYSLDLATGRATGKNVFGQVPVFLSDIAATNAIAPLTWNGSTSTAWNNPANWTPNQVPGPGDDVVIPGPGGTVQFQPTVSDAQSARGIALGTGLNGSQSVLTLADGANLQVYGSFANNDGTLASTGAGTGRISLVGNTTQDIGGGALSTFPNLVVGTGTTATTSSAAAIVRGLSLSGNLNIGTGQLFTLLSSTIGTAYVVNNGSAILNGNATVQRYIDASGNSGSSGARHYSSPITSATVNSLTTTSRGGSFTAQVNPAFNTQDPNTLTLATYPNVFSYDETKIPGSPAVTFSDFDKGYQSPQSLSDPLTVGRGYSVLIGNTEKVQFTGQVNNGNQTIGGLTRTGNTDGSGWALVGNPYPSPLDWGTVTNAQLTNVNAAVYVFQSTETYKGRYTSFTNGVGAGTGLIASSQGFFVRASGNTGSIALTNSNRAASADTKFQRTAAETRPLLRLSLGLGSSPATIATAQDETFVYFEQGATAGFDGKFDAYKLANPSGYYLGTTATAAAGDQPTNLSIDGRNPLVATSATEVVPVQLSAPAGTYSLTATSLLNFAAAGTQVYLRDALLGTLTNLATTPSYSFSIAANAASTSRFSLVFGSASALATAPSAALTQTLATLYPNPASGADNVTLAVTGLPQDARLVEATLVNALGQVVSHTTLAAAQGNARTNLATSKLAGGVYLLRLSAQNAQGQVIGSLPAQRLSIR